jgi:hypothetical protein
MSDGSSTFEQAPSEDNIPIAAKILKFCIKRLALFKSEGCIKASHNDYAQT